MKLILLPGFEKLNDVWTHDVKKGFNDNFDNIVVANNVNLKKDLITESDINLELENLINVINGYKQDYVIFAKTTGVLVVLKGIAEKKINPKKCVFLQVPVIRARINNIPIDDWLRGYDTETLFVQRRDDDNFYFNLLESYLKERRIENYNLIEIENMDVDFKEVERYKEYIVKYLSDVKELIV